MGVSMESIKELRKLTSASFTACKDALADSAGDVQKAVVLLRKRGLEIAAKKQGEVTREGRVEAYIHMGSKIGVLIEVDCETDFVARNSDFAQFAKDLAMQIAACSPAYIKREDVPKEALEQEPDKELFVKNNCLLEQPFIKDPGITIKDYLGSLISKVGENIIIRRFMRYKIGE